MGPHIQSQSNTITADLSHFGQQYSRLHEEFRESECLRHECGASRAAEVGKELERALRELQREACNLSELQELLGTSVFNFSLLNEWVMGHWLCTSVWCVYIRILTLLYFCTGLKRNSPPFQNCGLTLSEL